MGGDEVEWILSEKIISKLIAQTCYQPGLSTIFTDFMDFDGDEVYFYNHPSLVGKTFGDTLQMFENNAVLGLWKKDESPILNPPMESLIQKEDRIFLLAENDDQISLSKNPIEIINSEYIRNFSSGPEKPENILNLGVEFPGKSIII